jgi:hypothetical protein
MKLTVENITRVFKIFDPPYLKALENIFIKQVKEFAE